MNFNRKNQFLTLEKLYNSNENKVAVFYSSIDSDLQDIVKEFLINKDFFYYRAIQVSHEEQVKLFVKSINEQLSKTEITDVNYESALNAMMQAKCEKRVVVIDEFQYIVKHSNELISEILKCVNNKWGNQPVLFLLTSSNAYFVENQMVDKLSDTAYEISGLIKLKNLSFVDIMRHFSKYTKEELILTYGITSGLAKRVLAFDNNKSLKDNIINSILSEEGYLYNRGLNMLPSELRESSVYNTLLVNIASGLTKLNDLHKATGYSRAKVSVYLNNMIEHNLVEKIDSIDTDGRDNTVKGVYGIKDGFLAFYYRFVYPNLSLLQVIDKDKFYRKYIAPNLLDYGKEAYRKVCYEYIMLLNHMGNLPLNISESGRWLGKIGNIDIVCTDGSGKSIIGLCEFSKDEITFEDFEWLKFCVSKAKLTGDYYYLFSRKSFDEEIKNYVKEADNLFLIDLSML